MKRIIKTLAIFLILLCLISADAALAQNSLSLTTSASFVNRYNWRGMDFGDAFSVQPALGIGYGGFAAGFWGSYSSGFEEIDTWASYSHQIANSVKITGLVTDYFFPGPGSEFFNFNNYDDADGPGAHTLEVGLIVNGPEKFPIAVSGYINVYNDAGNCTYFQIDYTLPVGESSVNLFAGATGGSKEVPDYYGSEDFAFINLGAKISRSIKISDQFSLPVFGAFIVNPNTEESFLIFGFSL